MRIRGCQRQRPRTPIPLLLFGFVLLACSTFTGFPEEDTLPTAPPAAAQPTTARLDPGSAAPCQEAEAGGLRIPCPDGWGLLEDPKRADPLPGLNLGGEFLTALVDLKMGGSYSFQRAVLFYRYPKPPGRSLEAFRSEVYASAEHFYPENQREAPVRIDGREAVEVCYRVFWGEPAYELCDTWLPEGNWFYRISARTRWSSPEKHVLAIAEMDALIKSIRLIP